MVLRKELFFEKDTPYHILSRAVEKRKIFADENDRLRFIFQMHAANVGRPSFNLYRKNVIRAAKALLRGEEVSEKLIIIEHEPLVDILSFALVMNHYHFLLVAKQESGIPKYMQKLNGGFAMYFNLKHGREGSLFNKPYKLIPIRSDFQLDAIVRYINVKNPLDVYQPNWKTEGLKSEKDALAFLNNYQFSSYPDLFGQRQAKDLTSKTLLEKYLGGELGGSQNVYGEFIKDYLAKDLTPLEPFFLEE